MRKNIFILSALLLVAAPMGAQTFQQAFFLDGYRLGYRYNPALQNDSAFLGVGQWENQKFANLGMSSFLYPRDGEVVTALHSSVSASEFLGNLHDDNYLGGNINFNIFSYGWRKDKAYKTIEANIRSVYSASVPKEIFAIAKLGTGNTNYDLGGMGLAANAIVELAYGYSYKFSDRLSIGARAKFLAGIESINYKVTRFDMAFTEDAYEAQVEADLDLTSRWNKVRSDGNGYLNFLDLSAKESWKLPSGAGLSLDLGIVATPIEGLTLSASLLDLGGLFWYYGNAGRSSGTTSFSGFKELSMDDIKEGNVLDQLKAVQDEFIHSIKIKAVKSRVAFELIPFNVNLGARYDLPFYKAFAVGFSANYMGMKNMPYKEVRGVLAWNHFPWLGLTANAGKGSYGAVWGMGVNAALKQFRLTVGYSDGFGGTVPYSHLALKAHNKILTLGLTYDI